MTKVYSSRLCKKIGMALVTYYEKKVNFDDPSYEKISVY